MCNVAKNIKAFDKNNFYSVNIPIETCHVYILHWFKIKE
jgi:hypothetical protein